MDDLESMLQHMDAGNHSSARLNLPMGRKEDPGNWVEVEAATAAAAWDAAEAAARDAAEAAEAAAWDAAWWVPIKVQRELALAEMHKIKTEMLLHTVPQDT